MNSRNNGTGQHHAANAVLLIGIEDPNMEGSQSEDVIGQSVSIKYQTERLTWLCAKRKCFSKNNILGYSETESSA
jgi:hypothetical protein